MAFSLTWLPTVLLGAGLKVAEQPGWRTRGRGDVGAIQGESAITPSAREWKHAEPGVLTNGRPDLSGPLCQLGLGRDGTFFVIAAGRGNHAGLGNWQGVTTGNSSFIGIEAENTGHTTGALADPWPACRWTPPSGPCGDPEEDQGQRDHVLRP